jgi:hypothetical protein
MLNGAAIAFCLLLHRMAVSRKALSRIPCPSRGSLWLRLGHLNIFAPPNVDVPALGTGFAGVRFPTTTTFLA